VSKPGRYEVADHDFCLPGEEVAGKNAGGREGHSAANSKSVYHPLK